MKKKIITLFLITFLLIVFVFFLFNYNFTKEKKELPILGSKYIVKKKINGNTIEETIYHTIDNFNFRDQYGEIVNKKKLENKIYVADFFFTNCPTICPIMTTQMLRVYHAYKNNPNFKIISHSIDPFYDKIEILKNYAESIGVKNNNTWHFITGNKEKIYEIAQKSYFISTLEDKTVPGGIIHGGAFILVDNKFRIRGFYDGTKQFQVDNLIKDILILINK